MNIIPQEERTGKIERPPLRLHDIPGHEMQKRALEVALAGEHPIVLIYGKGSQAIDLIHVGKRIGEENGWAFHGLAYPVCPCGCYGHAHEECRCRSSVIAKHLMKLGKRIGEFDIWNDCPPDCLHRHDGEREEGFVSRIQNARKGLLQSIEEDIGTDCEELLRVYEREFPAAHMRKGILTVAKTIAMMEGSERIQSHHMAEAIQYQANVIHAIREWIVPQVVEAKTR